MKNFLLFVLVMMLVAACGEKPTEKVSYRDAKGNVVATVAEGTPGLFVTMGGGSSGMVFHYSISRGQNTVSEGYIMSGDSIFLNLLPNSYSFMASGQSPELNCGIQAFFEVKFEEVTELALTAACRETPKSGVNITTTTKIFPTINFQVEPGTSYYRPGTDGSFVMLQIRVSSNAQVDTYIDGLGAEFQSFNGLATGCTVNESVNNVLLTETNVFTNPEYGERMSWMSGMITIPAHQELSLQLVCKLSRTYSDQGYGMIVSISSVGAGNNESYFYEGMGRGNLEGYIY